MKIKFLLLGTSLSLIPSLTLAQCVATQDCETLGYTETSCNGGKGIKCPFGNSWACISSNSDIEQQFCDKYGFQYTCSGTGYSGGSGTSCNGKYTACTCSDGYEWKNGLCQQAVLHGAIGEFFYCNGTAVGVRATEMNFYVAIKDLGVVGYRDAGNLCSNYTFCDNLKGTLPTKEQLLSIYNHKSKINALSLAASGTTLSEFPYFSSTYYDSNNLYIVDMSSGRIDKYLCDEKYDSGSFVRPILTSW